VDPRPSGTALERTLHRDYYLSDQLFALERERPARTTVVCEFLFHPGEMAKSAFDPSDAVDFWDLVNRQDWAICESVQRGMASRVFQTGYYAPMESGSLDIRRYVGERLGDIQSVKREA
jgi:Rieske 2Fe-2S family protein